MRVGDRVNARTSRCRTRGAHLSPARARARARLRHARNRTRLRTHAKARCREVEVIDSSRDVLLDESTRSADAEMSVPLRPEVEKPGSLGLTVSVAVTPLKSRDATTSHWPTEPVPSALTSGGGEI